MFNRKRDFIRDLELALKHQKQLADMHRLNTERISKAIRCPNSCCRIVAVDNRGKIDKSMMPIAVEPSEAERTVRELAADNERLRSQIQSVLGQRDRANARAKAMSDDNIKLRARPASAYDQTLIDISGYPTVTENGHPHIILSTTQARQLKDML